MKTRRELKGRSAFNDKNKYAGVSELLGKPLGTDGAIINQRQFEQLMDVLVSSSFVEYKDGTLSEKTLDTVRNKETRNNK